MPDTPEPTSATTPTASWPMTGGAAVYEPRIFSRSEPHSPHACSSTTISPPRARGLSVSSMSTCPGPRRRTAFTGGSRAGRRRWIWDFREQRRVPSHQTPSDITLGCRGWVNRCLDTLARTFKRRSRTRPRRREWRTFPGWFSWRGAPSSSLGSPPPSSLTSTDSRTTSSSWRWASSSAPVSSLLAASIRGRPSGRDRR